MFRSNIRTQRKRIFGTEDAARPGSRIRHMGAGSRWYLGASVLRFVDSNERGSAAPDKYQISLKHLVQISLDCFMNRELEPGALTLLVQKTGNRSNGFLIDIHEDNRRAGSDRARVASQFGRDAAARARMQP